MHSYSNPDKTAQLQAYYFHSQSDFWKALQNKGHASKPFMLFTQIIMRNEHSQTYLYFKLIMFSFAVSISISWRNLLEPESNNL